MAGAALNTPKPSGPTFRISWAKTGKSATAPPNKTAIISKLITPRIIFVLTTNFTPSFKLFKTGSPSLGFKIGFLGIRVNAMTAINENPKINNIDQCTPIQWILKPASAGPKTAAS